MAQAEDSEPQAIKARQVNVRMTAEQERRLKQYSAKHGLTTNTVVLAALCAMIEGFENPDTHSPKLIQPESD